MRLCAILRVKNLRDWVMALEVPVVVWVACEVVDVVDVVFDTIGDVVDNKCVSMLDAPLPGVALLVAVKCSAPLPTIYGLPVYTISTISMTSPALS